MTEQLKEALLRIRDVQARTGLSRSSIYQLIKDGEFCAPIVLHGRSRAWVESEVHRWVEERIASARAGASK